MPQDPKQLFAALLIITGLSGCAEVNNPITRSNQESLIQAFTAGNVRFDCHIQCTWADVRQRNRLTQLYYTQRWEDLSKLVIETGWTLDRNYYLLGRSAEGLGLRQAAISYYSAALSLPRKDQCSNYASGTCLGVDVPSATRARLAALQRGR